MSVTVEQLWSERIEHNMPWVPGYKVPKKFRHRYVSIHPIRCVPDTYRQHLEDYYWGTRIKKSWELYQQYSAADSARFLTINALQSRVVLAESEVARLKAKWEPEAAGRMGLFKRWLHVKLLQWKLIV